MMPKSEAKKVKNEINRKSGDKNSEITESPVFSLTAILCYLCIFSNANT